MRLAGIKLSNYLDSPDYGLQARQVVRSQSKERQADTTSSWMKAMAESQGRAQFDGAQPGQDATRAAGAQAGQSAAWDGITDGIGSIVGGAIKGANKPPTLGVDRTDPGMGIPGSVAPSYKGEQKPYYGPAW